MQYLTPVRLGGVELRNRVVMAPMTTRLEAHGGRISVRVIAPDRVEVDRDDQIHLIEMRPNASGWANPAVTLGFRRCVDDFVAAIREERRPVSDGRDAARTHALLDEILRSAGLPVDEAVGRRWTSHAQ